MFSADQGGPRQGPQNTGPDVCLMLDDELGLEVADRDLIELDSDLTSLSDHEDSTLTVDGLQPTPGLSPVTSSIPKVKTDWLSLQAAIARLTQENETVSKAYETLSEEVNTLRSQIPKVRQKRDAPADAASSSASADDLEQILTFSPNHLRFVFFNKLTMNIQTWIKQP
jgi:chromosome segregation ATPase